ncbi:MAG: hypothetical protein ACYTXE_45490, partial [Nostoc sp.]
GQLLRLPPRRSLSLCWLSSNQDSCRIWLMIKSCSALTRMSSSPTDALANAEVASKSLEPLFINSLYPTHISYYESTPITS